MDALHLAVEDRVGIHGLAGGGFQPVGEADLRRALGIADAGLEVAVVGQRPQVPQLVEIGRPPFADRLGDGAGEQGIGHQQPAPRRDAVGLVVEALGKHGREIADRHAAQQIGMDGGHAIGAVRADDGQIGHAHLALAAFVDEAYPRRPPLIAGKALMHRLHQAPVDLVDDLQLARQHQLEPGHRPVLERFGQQGVIGIGQGPLGDIPGLVPAETLLVEQDPHQLRHRHRGMGVVELDGGLVGQRCQIAVEAAEAPHEIGQRAGDQEIFLDEAQSLTHGGRIVGIEHAGQGFRRQASPPPRRRSRRG